MPIAPIRILLLVCAAVAAAAVDVAPVAPPAAGLHPLFTPHMVLQRGKRVPVWGWAEPGATVTVAFAGQRVDGVAGADRRWRVELEPLESGAAGTLRVSGGVSATLDDVVVGEVWLCSGQSNMEMGITMAKDGAAEVAAGEHPQLRLFAVPRRIAVRPDETLVDNRGWQRCTPVSLASMGGWGGFSAVGYTFGRHLQQRLGVPVGLIHASWGGTRAEAWTGEEALGALAQHRDELAAFLAAREQTSQADAEARERAWWAAKEVGSSATAAWSAEALDEGGWTAVDLPGHVEAKGLPGWDGTTWFRRTLELPAAAAGHDLVLRLGPIDDRDVTWFNGERIGAKDVWNAPRVYRVPGRLVRAGTNRIAVRVLDTGGPGGFHGQPGELVAQPEGGTEVALAGRWLMRQGTPLTALGGMPQRVGEDPHSPTVLRNGMIAPLAPFPIAGAIWYQGESNAWSGERYARLLPALIGDWRRQFGCGDFPFLVVQLAAFMERREQPGDSRWAELREAQAQVAATVPRCGLAVAIDVGDAKDIHPTNKQEVGRRLGLAAERIAYGRDVAHSGPVFRSARFEDGRARVAFDHARGLRAAPPAAADAPPTGFAIAGDDGIYAWAQAAIVGDEVVLSSPAVPRPTRVRYAWADNPACDLVNGDGLPAVPFRTDGHPGP